MNSINPLDVEGPGEAQPRPLSPLDGLGYLEEDVNEYGIAGKIWCAETTDYAFSTHSSFRFAEQGGGY